MTTGARDPGTSTPSSPRRTGPLPALALALCALLGLTGLTACSGGSAAPDDASGSPSPSGSSSTTASAGATATPAAEQPPKVPAVRPGKAGQQAFAKHVMAVWGYGLRTDKAEPLTSLSPAGTPCRGCKEFRATLAQRRKQGWHVDFAGLDLRRLTTRKVGPNVYAKATVDIPASDSLNADGSFRNTSRAHRGATFEVLMNRPVKDWKLLAFTVS